jgi:hypothetical protein
VRSLLCVRGRTRESVFVVCERIRETISSFSLLFFSSLTNPLLVRIVSI